MNMEELKQKMAEIISVREDQGKVSEILTELTDEYETLSVKHDDMATQLDNIKKDNESLRDANMRLFLKVGNQEKEAEQKQEPEETKPDLNDLIDENGNIK